MSAEAGHVLVITLDQDMVQAARADGRHEYVGDGCAVGHFARDCFAQCADNAFDAAHDLAHDHKLAAGEHRITVGASADGHEFVAFGLVGAR